jgi:hypothetical protein
MRTRLRSGGTPLILIPVIALVVLGVPAQAGAAGPAPLPAGCTGKDSSTVFTIACTGDVSAPIDRSGTEPVDITVTGNLLTGAAITGSSGKDTITIKGDVRQGATVTAGDGDDTITAYDVGGLFCPSYFGGASNKGGVVDGGAGNDTITIGGGPVDPACAARFPGLGFPAGNVGEKGKVLGGDGDDTITAAGTGFVKNNPKDFMKSVEALGGTIDGGAGADKITVGYVAFPNDVGTAPGTDHMVSGVYGGDGNDTIAVGTAKNVLDSVNGDAGDDTITAKEVFTGSLAGGDGNDTISVTDKPLGGLGRVLGGAGNDQITAKSVVDTGKILGGPGDDVIETDSMNGADQPFSPFPGAYIGGDDGNDTIKVGMAWMHSQIDGDQGDNTITVDDLNGPDEVTHDWATPGASPFFTKEALVVGGDGNNKITLGEIGNYGSVRSGDGVTSIAADTLSQHASISLQGTKNTLDVSGNLDDEANVHGSSSDDTITVKGQVGGGAAIYGNNGDDTITADENYGVMRGDAFLQTGKLCTAVTADTLVPILTDQLKPALDDLKPIVDTAKNPPHLDIPGDYKILVGKVSDPDPEDPRQAAAFVLYDVDNMIDNNLTFLQGRPDDLGSPGDVAKIGAVIDKLTAVQKALNALVSSLDTNDCVVPESGKAGNDVLTVRVNDEYLSGDGGDDTIAVTTNTKEGKIEGNAVDEPAVTGTNTITVGQNDGSINGGGTDTTCKIGAGAGTVTGCGPPAGKSSRSYGYGVTMMSRGPE